METRIQYRSNCTVCGAYHAVDKNGRVAHHGYTVEYGYFDGACGGSKDVHYGHEDAPKVLARVLTGLNSYKARLPEMIEDAKRNVAHLKEIYAGEKTRLNGKALRNAESRVTGLTNMLEVGIDKQIAHFEKRLADHKVFAPTKHDVAKEEREKKEVAAAERAAKKAEKAAKAAEKKAKAEEREAKRKAKEAAQLEMNRHQLFYCDELVTEWVASYESHRDMGEDICKRAAEIMQPKVDSGELDKWTAEHGYGLEWKLRTNPEKGKGRQLDKQDRMFLFGMLKEKA